MSSRQRGFRLRRILSAGAAGVFGNPTALLLFALGLGIEGLLLSTRGHVWSDRPMAFVAGLLLLWFWLTASGLLWMIARLGGRTRRGVASAALDLLLGFVVAAAGIVYLGSWALFLRTGQFATLDSLRYSLIDFPRMTWFYVWRSEPHSLIAFGLLSLAVVAAVPFLLRRLRQAHWSDPPHPRSTFWRLTAWFLVAAANVWSLDRLLPSASPLRREERRALISSHLNPVVTLLSGLRDSERQENVETQLRPDELVPIRKGVPALPPGARPSIIFVKIESMRHDVLGLARQGRVVMPRLADLAASGYVFRDAYSQTTHTDYSDVSTLASLYPLRTSSHHQYRRDDPWPKTRIYDVLKSAGYDTAIVAGENLAWGAMDQFFEGPSLDLLYDAERAGTRTRIQDTDTGMGIEIRAGGLHGGTLDDRQTVDVALSWMASRSHPFFLFLDLQSPHFPYTIPAEAEQLFRPSHIDFDASFLHYPKDRVEVLRNAYDNALHESDRQLGRVLDALGSAGHLENTLLVAYGDHGEAFHEHGLVTHAGPPIEETARVPLVFCWPGHLKAGVTDYPAELIDVVPTVLGLMGVDPYPGFQGIDLLAPGRTAAGQRLRFLHTETPMSHEDVVVLDARWKYRFERSRRSASLFDLVEDPHEMRDLRPARPRLAARLEQTLSEWRQRQLAYYRFPAYYALFYPPAPPRWKWTGGFQ